MNYDNELRVWGQDVTMVSVQVTRSADQWCGPPSVHLVRHTAPLKSDILCNMCNLLKGESMNRDSI